MKRHPSIVPLSKDHHFGLLCCWKIRQGIRNGISPERIQLYVVYFRKHYLDKHFKEEEALLFHPSENDPLCQKAIAEHRLLEKMMDDFSTKVTARQLLDFADQLDGHIRFEERVLFPQLEKSLSEEDLASLGEKLKALHAVPIQEDYPDVFWENKLASQ